MNLPLTVLAELPNDRMFLVGDITGQIGVVTQEFRAMATDAVWGEEAIRVLSSGRIDNYKLPVVKPWQPWESVDTSAPAFDYDEVRIDKIIVMEKYALRCGFGTKTKRWIVQGELITAD